MVYRGGRKADNIMAGYTIWRLSTGETLVEWSKRTGVPYSSVISLLDKGLPLDETCQKALEACERHKSFKPVMYKGKTLHSCFPESVYICILKHMREKKLTVEEAVKLYKYNIKHPFFGYNTKAVIHVKSGKKFKTIKECGEYFKIPYYTMKKLVKKNKEFKLLEKENGL